MMMVDYSVVAVLSGMIIHSKWNGDTIMWP